MNITVISSEFPPEPGGIGEYSYQVADKLSALGYNITALICYQSIDEDIFTDFRKRQKFKIARIDGYDGKTTFLFKNIYNFKRIVVKNSTDLIIVVHPIFGLIGRILKIWIGIPYVIIGHGSEFIKINKLRDFLIKFSYEGSVITLPNSNFTASLIKKARINCNRIIVLYPGADDQLFDFSKYLRASEKKKKIILSVGALSLRKGHKDIIDALDILKNSYADFEYWIIGKGSEYINIKIYIEQKKLQKYVKLIGYVKREQLPNYYSQSDLFILGSSDADVKQVEGFGIVLLEANLMKKPVIGVLNTGMEEIILDGYNGFLVDVKNPYCTSEKIRELLSNDHLASWLGENGFQIAKKKFTWNHFAEKLDSIILDNFKKSSNLNTKYDF